MDKFYTVKQFADILQVHPNTIRRMIKEGRLHPVNVGKSKRPTYMIPEEDLHRLKAEGFKQHDEADNGMD